MSTKIHDQFLKYNELQDLLLSMDDDEKISEVKNFIDENNLLKNKNKTLSTIRLIASVVVVKPNILNSAVKLLNLNQSFDLYKFKEFFSSDRIADDEIMARAQVILLLFSLSKHGDLIDKEKYCYSEKVLITPTEFITSNRMQLYDFKDILQLKDEEKIKKRNMLYPIHPIVEFIKNDDLNSLQSYISLNNFDIDQKIKKSLFDVHVILPNSTPLEISSFFGSINCFKFLINKSQNVNYRRLLSLSFAGGNYDIIHIIEKEIHDIESMKKNNSCLYNAILYFHNDLIEYVIQNYQVRIDAEAYIKCIYASNYGAMLKLHEIDDSDAINEFGKIGSTPIDIASFEGYIDFMKFLLLECKVDYKKLNSYGKTILQSASRSGKLYIVKYILKNKLVDPNDKGRFRLSAVRIARNYYNKDVMAVLKPISNDNLEEEEICEEDEDDDEDEDEDEQEEDV
ncbi:hypothetical protein M9Y10_038668 [Tritrichomonas musculus]|uniref:DUF3447 domain-containing protein n=1 Tax=Tritrichomonas musculus TaxID=1915356 RepID=A0ABR2KA25_9EUKA